MKTIARPNYHPFLLWMSLLGFTVFALWICWREGWLTTLLIADRSHISVVIMLLFTAMTAHCGFHIYMMAHAIHHHRLQLPYSNTDLHDHYELGWFIVDVLIKLGLLGTVVGFIFMLSSLASITRLDIEIAQKLMTDMGAGMGIALYTTLTGLLAAIALSAQYYILESITHHFIATEPSS